VLTTFIRIATNTRLHQRPLTLKEARDRVQSWMDQPCARIIHPAEQHWAIFQRMLKDGNATGV
jgi:predicted nucleic acid-binding protein